MGSLGTGVTLVNCHVDVGVLTVHVTKNTIYMPALAGVKFRRKPYRL